MSVSLCSLQGKGFQALLNGLARKIYYNNKDITNEYLAEELFQQPLATVSAEIFAVEEILRKAARENWDASKLDTSLAEHSLLPEQARIFVAFWTNEKEKIIRSLRASSVWGDKFNSLSWRVDLKSASRANTGVDEPVALFEWRTTRGDTGAGRMAKFEMTADEVGKMVVALDSVSKALSDVLKDD